MSQRLHRLLAISAAGAAVGAIGLSTTPAMANVEVGATAGPHTFSQVNELGVNDSNNAASLRNSVLFGLRFGFYFSDMLGVEVEAGTVPSESRNLVFDVWTAVYRAQIVAQFRASVPENKLIPFVALGAGVMQVVKTDNPNIIEKDKDPEFYLGVGVKYRVENGWGLRADLRGIAVPSSKLKADGTSDNNPVFDTELLLSVYKEWGRKEPTKAAPPPPPAEKKDSDGDGIADDDDKCPNDPEDMDGFQDDDGCPDPDNDGDGIPDDKDQCKNEAEDKDGFQDDDGCPDPDNDGDGILDANDKCPNDAEDKDGFQDDDGCPDPDNDGDGVPDAQDQCPNEMETHNGYKDDDGCADEVPAAVKKFTGVIKGINFKNDSDQILKSSNKILDAAVKVLKDNVDVKLEIQGHTDDTGTDEHDNDLSQRRADAVKAYFVKAGIDEGRLVAKGYGKTKPLVNAKTKAARAKNRRVEFELITDTTGGDTGTTPTTPPAPTPPSDGTTPPANP